MKSLDQWSAADLEDGNPSLWPVAPGIPFAGLAERFGTPFFLYDLATIGRQVQAVKHAFGDRFQLLYAVKANSNLEILRFLHGLVDGLDVSSMGEVEQAILAGHAPESMSFAGPGKRREDLKAAIEWKVGVISIESLRELVDLHEIAHELSARPRITLRVNPSRPIAHFPLKMGGKATQFGLEEEEIGSAVEFVTSHSSSFDFAGIHVYSGTQCLHSDALIDNVKQVLEIVRTAQTEHACQCSRINVGGGFGVSYHEEGVQLDLRALSLGVMDAVNEFEKETHSRPTYVIELGRYLTAESGIYVTRAVSEKVSRDQRFVVLDGGMNHHLAASGNLGAGRRRNYMAVNLSKPGGEKQTCHLVGPLCTPIDLMGYDVELSAVEPGDLVGFPCSGSYGFSASPFLFLGHPTALELTHLHGTFKVARSRMRLVDFNDRG
ncbi:MAG: hypothetical protein A2289_08275 [Deltaproteobacteria bacterium RIFOXYA12_FULL_58_15]|nr:MAG: hypothetical protein A2289_08275 [Deltaproteobacteria bacterium RIFOXYA12_FULL_58_15]OGR09119.1 MAG: hypothetical protein A2341_10900 [Deltaproteobacteria bacterium RIFOXYB12_FULL_58_9]